MKNLRSFTLFIGWIGALVAALVILNLMGRGMLALPTNTADGWSQWLQTTNPAIIFFALGRVVAVVGALYLMITTTLTFIAHSVADPALDYVVQTVTIPSVQRTTQRALGLTVVGMLALPATTAAAATTTDDTPLLRNVTSTSGFTASTEPQRTTLPKTTSSVPTPTAGPDEVAPATTTDAPKQWTVKPGENMWAAAERVLTKSWGRKPTNREVASYWQQLIETNRDALSRPADPNLVYPEQTFTLPPIPAAP